MDVKQIYELVNAATASIVGETTVLNEDLSNLVDFGTEVLNANAVDNYVRSLVDHIGKVIFVNRPYYGTIPSMLRNSWEFGSVLQKVRGEMPEAAENESWELEDGASYDQQVFYKPVVEAKFFNSKVTFEIQQSITERQVKESFSNVAQLNAFIEMLYNEVDKSLTVKVDALIMRTLNSLIAETVADEYPAPASTTPYGSSSGVRAVNLLYLYNAAFPNDTTTAAACLTKPAFLRFAALTMGEYIDYMAKASKLFNVDGKTRFTPKQYLNIVMLSKLQKASQVYLEADTYWKDLVSLPNGVETVPYWQGSGDKFAFADVSKIDVKTANNNTVELSGILAIMFDRDAAMVCNTDKRVTTAPYNAKGEFWNNFHKYDCSYFVDLAENAVVFFVADAPAA